MSPNAYDRLGQKEGMGNGLYTGSNGQASAPLRRRASHAGSWYAGDGRQLQETIRELLGQEYAEGATPSGDLKATIVPHAGLSYSGGVAAAAYSRLDTRTIRRIIMLGPSHHARVDGCGIPGPRVGAYQTPLGDLPLDVAALAALRATGGFDELSMAVDEAEHSLEMQLPFLAELLLHGPTRASPPPGLVPILVGHTSAQTEAYYARLLAPYLEEEGNLFVVSSDFCHWGARFEYTRTGSPELAETYRDGPHPENASIEGLDRAGMALIARRDAAGFRKYLMKEGNTICGRHPILVLLETFEACKGSHSVDFIRYAQSSAMEGQPPPRTASVSYACACCKLTPEDEG